MNKDNKNEDNKNLSSSNKNLNTSTIDLNKVTKKPYEEISERDIQVFVEMLSFHTEVCKGI